MPISWNEIRSHALAFSKEWAAYDRLDRAVDKCYHVAPLANERSRVEYLFTLHQKLTEPLLATQKTRRKKKS